MHDAFLSDYDPFDLSSPHGNWTQARQDAPVFFHEPTGYWVVTKKDDIKSVFADWETFSSDNAQAPVRPLGAPAKQVMKDGGFTAYSGLSARVPPDHSRIRKVVQPHFGPKRFKAIEPQIERIVASHLDAIADLAEVDFYREVAYPVPALVLFTLLGIPDKDVPNVKKWAESRSLLTWGNLDDQAQVPHAKNMVDYWDYCRGLVAARKQTPGNDLPTDLVAAQNNGADISDDEIAGVMYSVLFAGHETTTTLMANAIETLITNRAAWDALVEDPTLIPNTTEEVLRFGPSIVAWRRRAKTEAQVGDTTVPADANLLLVMASGNRDEAHFSNPHDFDIHRKNARDHLSFGSGIHFCIGFQLAKMEFGIMLRQLSQRFPNMKLKANQNIEYMKNVSFRVPNKMIVELGS